MVLTIDLAGTTRCLYTEVIDLEALGKTTVRRASHVEPCPGGWSVDMSPVGGQVYGPFAKRSEALAAETRWLEEHVL